MTFPFPSLITRRALTFVQNQATGGAATGAVQDFTLADRTSGGILIPGVTVAVLGLYGLVARTFVLKIVKQNSTTNFDTVANQSIAHGGTGWENITLSSPYVVPGSGTYNLACYTAAGGSNPTIFTPVTARSFASGDQTGAGWTATAAASAQVYIMQYGYY